MIQISEEELLANITQGYKDFEAATEKDALLASI